MKSSQTFQAVTATDWGLNLLAALPEVLLLVCTLLVLLADIFWPGQKEGKRAPLLQLSLLAIIPSLVATVMQMGGPTYYAFSNTYVADEFAHLLKLCAYIAVAVSLIYASEYLQQRDLRKGEFYLLALFSLLGQMVMISANNLLVIYVGLELLSLSLYAMAALRRDSVQAVEAAMKYFVLGALASGFLLYGMSMIYGGAGTLEITKIARALSVAEVEKTATFGVVFVVAGLAFKFGAVPFHMWVPDVYEGTPSAVTLLIAGAPKLAAFAIAFRMLVEALTGISHDWQQMLMMLSVASIALGNVVAIAQTNFKRMLAYSTISHVGFVFLGLLSGVVKGDGSLRADAYSAATFYIITYVLTTLGTFGVLMALARRGFECDRVDDLKGLYQRAPWLAVIMLLLMFSMAGIPPLVGFYAKLEVINAVMKAGHLWLAIVAVLFSLIGAFYYLRIVKVMMFDAPVEMLPVEVPSGSRATLAVNGALILVLGLGPGMLMVLCMRAVLSALGS
jgi:NADH-quinone oxidoreductase subunit N